PDPRRASLTSPRRRTRRRWRRFSLRWRRFPTPSPLRQVRPRRPSRPALPGGADRRGRSAERRLPSHAYFEETVRYNVGFRPASLKSRAWLERGPIHGLDELFVGREKSLKGEREGSGSVLLQVREPLLGLVERGEVPGGNPPERHGGSSELLEPLRPGSENLGMRGAIKGLAQGLHRLPDPHVDEDSVVVLRAKVGRGCLRRLHSPDETPAF